MINGTVLIFCLPRLSGNRTWDISCELMRPGFPSAIIQLERVRRLLELSLKEG